MKKTTFGFYNENSARNAPFLTINGVHFYFSYSTLVGVNGSAGQFIIQNRWGNTTGKHLNWLDRGCYGDRLDQEEFDQKVKEAMKEAKIKELPTININ